MEQSEKPSDELLLNRLFFQYSTGKSRLDPH
jgi:hypothetical protein